MTRDSKEIVISIDALILEILKRNEDLGEYEKEFIEKVSDLDIDESLNEVQVQELFRIADDLALFKHLKFKKVSFD